MDENEEVLEMLVTLILQSEDAGNGDTLIKQVSLESFQWVLNEAAKIINRTIVIE